MEEKEEREEAEMLWENWNGGTRRMRHNCAP